MLLRIERAKETTHTLTHTVPLTAMFLVYLLLASSISLAWHATYTAQASLTPPHETSAPHVSDHLALMSFKSHIRSDPKQALASWGNTTIPMCQWLGVVCGNRNRRGRVVALDLAKLNLLGMISPALGNLTYLRQLHLSQNRFHGILPQDLGKLHDLETLQLDSNSIYGQIPPSLSNCSRLVNISFNFNKLQGGIPSEFSSLHNLELLSLADNRLTGRIPSWIGSLVNLKELVLEKNNMTGEIPKELGSLVNLLKLGLGSNQLSGAIPSSLGNLTALTILSVSPNMLEGSIPPLHGLSSINILDLGGNRFEGTIPSWLGNLSTLLFLDLQKNHLVGHIPESLGNLQQLTALSLATNNLTGYIPHALGNLHDLTQLYLDENYLEGSFPSSMLNLSSLEFLDIQQNNLNGILPANLGTTLSKLKLFSVANNQFHGVLPSFLCNTSMLESIQTFGNFMSGTIPQCLGTRQDNLSVVTLSGNQFEATNDADWGFLTALSNCSNLMFLDLGSNKLRGLLPNSIGNLSTQMKILSIQDNHITGTITEGIGNLINLYELYLDHNALIGAIPASLGKLKKLNVLILSNNNLSGPIPTSLGNLTELATLILRENAINGAIPSSLSHCPFQALDLSQNNLNGPVPLELFSVSTLSVFMYLAHNSLSGTLPPEVRNLKSLSALDLSNNILSGDIPTSIGECQSLEYLNISKNIIEGEIPLSIGDLKGLLRLDLSYNNLTGTIPEVLGNLIGLSSLNLSFNKFQGEVPSDGVFRNATAILIAGNKGLCGGIPQLKLPPCSNHTTMKPHRKLAVIVSICSAFVFVTLVFALYGFCKKWWMKKANLQSSVMNEQYMRVSYSELSNATNGFATDNLIGAGSFGSVYKGRMSGSGQHVVVAVKVLNLMQRGAFQSFIAECETLRCARHRNLVKILTVCSSIDFQGHDFKALVYEFLPNGNLDKWLHQNINEDGEQRALDLIARLNIAIDVASSLEYLHRYKPVPIIHCDLKPSNVLLDGDMVAHVGDFGLARFLHQDSEKSSGWASMRGSIGYVAPEYGLGNEASTHGDVYSYGILLLEMFTGKRPTDSEFEGAMGIRNYVRMALPDRVSITMDQQLLTGMGNDETSTLMSSSVKDMRIACITSILEVGIRCCEEVPMDRMPIEVAVQELQALRVKFQKQLSSEGAS